MHISCCARITEHTTTVLLHNWQVADTKARQVGDVRGQGVSTALSSPSPDKRVFEHHSQSSFVKSCALPRWGVVGRKQRWAVAYTAHKDLTPAFPSPSLPSPCQPLCSYPLTTHTIPALHLLIPLHQPFSVIAIATLPGSHSFFPCNYLLLPAPISHPQHCSLSNPLFSHQLSLPTPASFWPSCLALDPNAAPSEACPCHCGVHQHGCLPIPLLCPRHQQEMSKRDNTVWEVFLPKAIKVLDFDHCDFCTTGFTVLGVTGFFLACMGIDFCLHSIKTLSEKTPLVWMRREGSLY